jgi:hypothetical protein
MRIALAALWLIAPILAAAQSPTTSPETTASRDGDLQLRINGPIHVAAGDSASAVWVINGDAIIDGSVRDGLGVINGTARVGGHINGTVIVVSGHLELLPGARLDQDVILHRSTITRAPDVAIAGLVHQRNGFSFGVAGMWLLWLSFTAVVVVAGVLFAAIAPKVLAESAVYFTEHPGPSAVAALIAVPALPTIAILSFVTVIGIPLGLTILLVVVPALSFLGYLIAGAALGAAMSQLRWSDGVWPNRYRMVVFGLVLLQIIGVVPGLGGLLVLIASQLGAGALIARRWSERKRRPLSAAVPVPIEAGAR